MIGWETHSSQFAWDFPGFSTECPAAQEPSVLGKTGGQLVTLREILGPNGEKEKSLATPSSGAR